MNYVQWKSEYQQENTVCWFLPLTDTLFQLSKYAAVEGVDLGEYAQYLS